MSVALGVALGVAPGVAPGVALGVAPGVVLGALVLAAAALARGRVQSGGNRRSDIERERVSEKCNTQPK